MIFLIHRYPKVANSLAEIDGNFANYFLQPKVLVLKYTFLGLQQISKISIFLAYNTRKKCQPNGPAVWPAKDNIYTNVLFYYIDIVIPPRAPAPAARISSKFGLRKSPAPTSAAGAGHTKLA